MSEFKYACPVCGQHIKCDSSESGSVMECPTCFQKITVPQAPATDDPKFIITGIKVGERPAPKIADGSSSPVPAEKNLPLAVVIVLLVLIAGAGAAVFAFRGKIFKSAGTGPSPIAATNKTNPAPPKPAPVAPPANDTNWMLNLDAVSIPNSAAAGRIHGRDFIVEQATFQNSTLFLHGPKNLSVDINFGDAWPEALAGQSLNITTNATAAARVTLGWKEGDQVLREIFTNSYALRLDCSALARSHMPVKIYLCTADAEKSYIAGTFNAEIRRSRPKRQN